MRKGGQEAEGKDSTPTQFTVTSPARLIPLATLALPAKLRLTGRHLPVRSSAGAPHSETKEGYRHHAAQHDKQPRPF